MCGKSRGSCCDKTPGRHGRRWLKELGFDHGKTRQFPRKNHGNEWLFRWVSPGFTWDVDQKNDGSEWVLVMGNKHPLGTQNCRLMDVHGCLFTYGNNRFWPITMWFFLESRIPSKMAPSLSEDMMIHGISGYVIFRQSQQPWHGASKSEAWPLMFRFKHETSAHLHAPKQSPTFSWWFDMIYLLGCAVVVKYTWIYFTTNLRGCSMEVSVSSWGTPSHYPFLDRIFHEINQPVLGTPICGNPLTIY